jgi:DNA-binding MarR family transcriptional regulator
VSTPAGAATPDEAADAAVAPRLLYVLQRLSRASLRMAEERLREFNLTAPQYTALSVLAARTGLSNAQLARRCYVTPQSMSEVILELERRELIRRAPDRLNKRILRTVLTTEGRGALAACDAAIEEVETLMLRTLPPDTRVRLRAELVECVHSLGAGL